MRQFLAILRDSFREAVDGFVIYAMLALSLLMIVLLGSLSFTPAPPDQAFNTVVRRFTQVYPEKGPNMDFLGDVRFEATDVRPAGAGYALRVKAVGMPMHVPDGEKPLETDTFRNGIAGWGKERAGGRGPGFRHIVTATPDEIRAVTDERMAEFVRRQFASQAGMDVTAARVPAGAGDDRAYLFDVTTTGGASLRGWPHTIKILFGAWTWPKDESLGEALFWIENQLVNGIGATLLLLISVVITAFFIPNMIRKGSLDLLIAKPIGRSQLLVYKYVGGLTFIFLVSCVAVGGVWLVLAARTGYWDPTFLIVIPVLTFTFAILYAVSAFAAVFTRSAIVAILLAVGFAFFLYIVGQLKTVFDLFKNVGEDQGGIPAWAISLVDTLNNVLPRYKDLDKLTTKLLSAGTLTPAEMQSRGLDVMEYPSWGGTVGVSLAFIALVLGLACWRFQRRDS
jgi:ABC-type transport system involved in multi-copper enzyme maturation permease subunit